jgi:Flp pilus assembly protein TadG
MHLTPSPLSPRILQLRSQRRARAQSLLEFGLVLPLLLAMMLGIMEGGRLVITHYTLVYAAAEGARAGAFAPASAAALTNIDARVKQVAADSAQIGRITVNPGDIAICRRTSTATSCNPAAQSTGASGQVIEVTVTHVFQWTPTTAALLGRSNLTMTAFDSARID